MNRVTTRQFVVQHQNPIGWLLGALVLLTIAFDYFIGFGGIHLIGLRLVYFVLMSFLVGYVYLTSTQEK
jgi:hypothetical protein